MLNVLSVDAGSQANKWTWAYIQLKSKHMDLRQIKRHTIPKAMHNRNIFMEANGPSENEIFDKL